MKKINGLALKLEESEKNISNLKKEIKKIKLSKNISLDEEQKERYELWNRAAKEGILKAYETEKEFLIGQKEMVLRFEKFHYDELVCESNGHIEEIMSTDSHGVYVNCKKCGAGYTRPMNSEESKSFYDLMETPFNI